MIVIVLLFHVTTVSAKNQDSSGACNADANSLKYDVNHMCGGRKTELLYVSHASYCGETVSKGKTSGPPTIRWKNAKPGEMYTLVMADPDAPPKTQGEFWVHWIVTGVSGQDLMSGGEVDGKVVENFGYNQPTPPRHTGQHKYQFYLFESTGKDVKSSQTSRGGFSLAQFVSENNICRLAARFQYQVDPPS